MVKASTWFVCSTVFAGIYWARFAAVNSMQELKPSTIDAGVFIYDLGCGKGPFDPADAEDVMKY